MSNTKKQQIEAIAQAAAADADALSAVYQDVFTSRLNANLEAIAANVAGTMAAQHAKVSKQIATTVANAYAKQAEAGAVQIVDTPIAKFQLQTTSVDTVDVDMLLPDAPKPKLRLA